MNSIRQQKDWDFKAVVFDDFAGIPYSVTFIGNQWWVTTPGEKLMPLNKFMKAEGIGFCFLCENEGTAGALVLAKMLGKALTNPEDKVDEVLRQRVGSLKRLGITLDAKDEPLVLELEFFTHEERSFCQGNFSAFCHLCGNSFETIFDIDAFDSMHDAKEWVGYFFDTLENIGIEFKIV